MPLTAFQKRMRDERWKKIAFIENQLEIFQRDLDRLKLVLEEVKILETKVYGLSDA